MGAGGFAVPGDGWPTSQVGVRYSTHVDVDRIGLDHQTAGGTMRVGGNNTISQKPLYQRPSSSTIVQCGPTFGTRNLTGRRLMEHNGVDLSVLIGIRHSGATIEGYPLPKESS